MLSSSIQAIIAQTLIKKSDGSGRVAALEVLLGTPGVRNLIRENKIPQINSLIQVGSKFGMISMRDYLEKLVKDKKITSADATSVMSLVTATGDFEDKADEGGDSKHNTESRPAFINTPRNTSGKMPGDENF